MSEIVQLQWRDRANNETKFRVFRNDTPEILLHDNEIIRVEWDGTTWGVVEMNTNVSNATLETSNSPPSVSDELFKIQFTDAQTGTYYYGVSAGNAVSNSDVVPTDTSITIS